MAYFPAVVFLGKVTGSDAGPSPAGRAALGGRLHACWRGCSTGSACGATARLEVDRVVKGFARYIRLLGHLGRYTLNRELAFRGNFLVKISVEVLWLFILVAFYRTVFARTRPSRAGPRTSTSSSSAAFSRSTV